MRLRETGDLSDTDPDGYVGPPSVDKKTGRPQCANGKEPDEEGDCPTDQESHQDLLFLPDQHKPQYTKEDPKVGKTPKQEGLDMDKLNEAKARIKKYVAECGMANSIQTGEVDPAGAAVAIPIPPAVVKHEERPTAPSVTEEKVVEAPPVTESTKVMDYVLAATFADAGMLKKFSPYKKGLRMSESHSMREALHSTMAVKMDKIPTDNTHHYADVINEEVKTEETAPPAKKKLLKNRYMV